MAEEMISGEDARLLNAEIHRMIDELEAYGFSRSHVSAAMAGVGLAIHHWRGGDIDSVFARCLDAIEIHETSTQ